MVEGLRGWASSPKPFLPERPTLMRRPLPLSESLFRTIRRGRDLVALDPGRSIAADFPELVEGQHLAMRLTGAALPFDLGAGFESLGHSVLPVSGHKGICSAPFIHPPFLFLKLGAS